MLELNLQLLQMTTLRRDNFKLKKDLEDAAGYEPPLETFLSDTMYLSIVFRNSTPPQNRQLNILISNSKQ
jgi:hypothetical protein